MDRAGPEVRMSKKTEMSRRHVLQSLLAVPVATAAAGCADDDGAFDGGAGDGGSSDAQIAQDGAVRDAQMAQDAGRDAQMTQDAQVCDLTPDDVEGPFYTADAPVRMQLAADEEPGDRITVRGRVLDVDGCTPLAGYVVDAWHADAAGAYDNEGFKLRGKMSTDASGAFAIDTVRPGRYPDRPFIHIHFKIRRPDGGEVLTSQLYFDDDPQLPRDGVRGPVISLAAGVGTVDIIVPA